MSTQPTEESLEDVEVPTDEADAVTGGGEYAPCDDEPAGGTRDTLNAI